MTEIQDYRLTPETSVLVIVDFQERLMAAMPEGVRERTISSIGVLIAAAARFGIPTLATEQYPRGLGPTVSEIAGAVPDFAPIEKISFSCAGEEEFTNRLRALDRSRVILTGCETHVCCYQTALDLMASGFVVHAVADALCSRRKLNWRTGLSALERAGAIPTTTEQAVFDLLRVAGTEDFKALSQLIK